MKFSKEKLAFLARYVVVGGLGACFYAASYCTLVALTGGQSVISSLIAYAAAVVVQYYSHARYSFGVSAHDKNQAVKFLAVTAAGFALSSTIAFVGPRIGWTPLAIALAVVISIPLFNLLAFSIWVFKSPAASTADAFKNP